MKKYSCEHCLDDFNTKDELLKHINESHPITKSFDLSGESDLGTIED